MSDAPGREARDPADRIAGLCAACRQMRVVVSNKGSRFYLCARAAHDPAYRRYPPIPVRSCPGFDPLDVSAASSRPASESSSLMSSRSALQIRPAVADDTPLILSFIRQLAAYENLSHAVKATEATLRATLFAERPPAEVIIAEDAGTPVGFALFFQNYSTFLAQPGIYLEDLFVIPAARGRGVGKQLLERLAAIALERGCGRLEWAVLDWNAPAIGFYRRMGAVAMDDWTVYRLTGPALSDLARSSSR